MRVWLLLAACLAGCAAPQRFPKRPDFSAHPAIKDPADALKVYYDWRLEPRGGSYGYGKMQLSRGELPAFFDAQGDSVAAAWAGRGNAFRWSGLGIGLALAGATVAVAQSQPTPPSPVAVGAMALIPGGLVFWTFEFVGEGWFRKPAVAKYNRDVKRELKLSGE